MRVWDGHVISSYIDAYTNVPFCDRNPERSVNATSREASVFVRARDDQTRTSENVRRHLWHRFQRRKSDERFNLTTTETHAKRAIFKACL